MKKLATEGCRGFSFADRGRWVRQVKRANPSYEKTSYLQLPTSNFQLPKKVINRKQDSLQLGILAKPKEVIPALNAIAPAGFLLKFIPRMNFGHSGWVKRTKRSYPQPGHLLNI